MCRSRLSRKCSPPESLFCCCFHSPFSNLLFCPFSNLLFHFKIKSIEVNLHTTKHTPLYVYSSMSFDRCIYPGNYHPKEDIEFFHNVKKCCPISIQLVTPTPHGSKQWCSSCHYRFLLPFLGFHVNEAIQSVFFYFWLLELSIICLRVTHIRGCVSNISK